MNKNNRNLCMHLFLLTASLERNAGGSVSESQRMRLRIRIEKRMVSREIMVVDD
jgi:hypothetical protein